MVFSIVDVMSFYCLHQKKKKKLRREEISFCLQEVLMKGLKVFRKVMKS